jgi:hypothetical protein
MVIQVPLAALTVAGVYATHWIVGRFAQNGFDPAATANVLNRDAKTFGVDTFKTITAITNARDLNALISGIHAFSRVRAAMPEEMTTGLNKTVGFTENVERLVSWRIAGMATAALDPKRLAKATDDRAISAMIQALWLLGRTGRQIKIFSEEHTIITQTLAHVYQQRTEHTDMVAASLLHPFAANKATEIMNAVAGSKECRDLIGVSGNTVGMFVAYALSADITPGEQKSLTEDVCQWFPEPLGTSD